MLLKKISFSILILSFNCLLDRYFSRLSLVFNLQIFSTTKKWMNFVSNQSIDRSIDFVLFLFFFSAPSLALTFLVDFFFNFQRKIMNVFREFKKKKPFFLDWIIVICRTIFLLGCCCRNVECLFWIWKSTWPEKQTLVMIRILVILFFLNQKPNKHKIHTLSNRVFFLLKKFWEKKKSANQPEFALLKTINESYAWKKKLRVTLK